MLVLYPSILTPVADQVLSSYIKSTEKFESCTRSGDIEITFIFSWGAHQNSPAGILPTFERVTPQLSLNYVSHIDLLCASHFQGGYSTNLAPSKLVGKLFTSIDKSIHRMIGTVPPPPAPPSQENNFHSSEHNNSVAPKVTSSQSTMALSSLMASTEPEWAGGSNRMMPNRSISEPNFGRDPKQVSLSWQIFFYL